MNSPLTVHHQNKTGRDSHIPFGLRLEVQSDGTIVEKMYEPMQVLNGYACDCICPECRQPLNAKANKKVDSKHKRKPHFAHKLGENCAYARESAIHRAAKQLIEQRKELYVPERLVTVSLIDALGREHIPSIRLHAAGVVKLIHVRLEKYIEDVEPNSKIKPDLIITTVDGIEMIIEIAVTHPADDAKRKKIANIGLPAIEIDISKIPSIDFDLLAKALFGPYVGAYWLFHPQDKTAENQLFENLALILELAKQKKERQEMQALKQLYEQEAREKEQERIAAEKRARELDRGKKFNAISSVEQKLTKFLNFFKIQKNEIPWYLDCYVRGERSFGVPRKIWQLAIFAKFIEGKDTSFNQKDVLEWLQLGFAIVEEFDNSPKVAIWDFLFNLSLSEIGVLKHLGSQQFEVKQNNLKKLIEKKIERPIKIPDDQIRSENLEWVVEEDWPDIESAKRLAEKYRRNNSKVDWQRIAGLFANAREKTVDEVVSRYYVKTEQDTKEDVKKQILRFMLEVEFLRLVSRK